MTLLRSCSLHSHGLQLGHVDNDMTQGRWPLESYVGFCLRHVGLLGQAEEFVEPNAYGSLLQRSGAVGLNATTR